MRGPDVGAKLSRALIRSAAEAGGAIEIDEAESTPWASATFIGERHSLTARGAFAKLSRWIEALPDAEFEIGGHIVVSLDVVEASADRLRIELLILEDR
ncbi:hypothetical protein BH09PSE4_BH09PSE4_13760 [soil metagenome]